MKTIATINFKGGVGKTTVTWCLGDVLSTHGDANILLFDLDAQMSLTQAISLDADGNARGGFDQWLKNNKVNEKNLYKTFRQFMDVGKFDFCPDDDFVYRLRDNYHFIPSTEELYWLELENHDPGKAESFIDRLLGNISHSQALPKYDYALFDCPPSFTLLSSSVLTCCDLILVPANPDFFAAQGVRTLLEVLIRKIKPHPLPKVVVFANRVKTWRMPTRAARRWIADIKDVCDNASTQLDIEVRYLNAWIPDRAAIRDSVTNRKTPGLHVGSFIKLWQEIRGQLK